MTRKQQQQDGIDGESVEASAAPVDKEDKVKAKPTGKEDGEASVASKSQLQAAVKTLGMGPSAYKGLPKDDPAAYCKELQKRVLAFVNEASGEKHQTLPSAEELAEVKKALEAKQELSALDASNILEGRPKRRAASSAAEAIKRDIARDLEREAAQAASEPPTKKSKSDKEAEPSAAAAAAGSGKSSSSSKGSKAAAKSEAAEEEDDEEDEEEEEDAGSSESDGSSSSDTSDDEEDEDEEEDEEEEAEEEEGK